MNPQQMLPFIGATLSIGGIIFQTGKHAEKIDFVFGKVEAQEKKVEYTDQNVCEIKSDLKTLSHDISAIKQDVQEIKRVINKI
tara:strand:- start:244 stop:492 length:249 start_codon:yes stop_codon:yes gene_type:complete